MQIICILHAPPEYEDKYIKTKKKKHNNGHCNNGIAYQTSVCYNQMRRHTHTHTHTHTHHTQLPTHKTPRARAPHTRTHTNTHTHTHTRPSPHTCTRLCATYNILDSRIGTIIGLTNDTCM